MRDLFLQYPNVIAYVAGHTHDNRVDLFRKGSSGFWQINTASHVDWPQQSRLIEVMDNRDGTLSLFDTLLDQAAPIAAPAPGHGRGVLTDAQLGSLSRVLAWNDPQRAKPDELGRTQDRNVELVLRDPRDRTRAALAAGRTCSGVLVVVLRERPAPKGSGWGEPAVRRAVIGCVYRLWHAWPAAGTPTVTGLTETPLGPVPVIRDRFALVSGRVREG